MILAFDTKLSKIISGAQAGADLAALCAAKNFNIATGGHVPNQCRTYHGNRPEYIHRFSLTETQSTGYQNRTELNVKNADATIILASNFHSAGTALTRTYAERFNRPLLEIELNGQCYDTKADSVAKFISGSGFSVVNIAGNTDRCSEYGPHYKDSYEILCLAFLLLQQNDQLMTQPMAA